MKMKHESMPSKPTPSHPKGEGSRVGSKTKEGTSWPCFEAHPDKSKMKG